MTNEEINSHFQESLIVWNAYNRSMQSGVLPKAYMFGVAVLSSHCQIEFVDNYKTGIIISDNKNEIELKSAVDTIINNRIYFSINCRKYFIDHFYYKNVGEEFVEIN